MHHCHPFQALRNPSQCWGSIALHFCMSVTWLSAAICHAHNVQQASAVVCQAPSCCRAPLINVAVLCTTNHLRDVAFMCIQLPARHLCLHCAIETRNLKPQLSCLSMLSVSTGQSTIQSELYLHRCLRASRLWVGGCDLLPRTAHLHH